MEPARLWSKIIKIRKVGKESRESSIYDIIQEIKIIFENKTLKFDKKQRLLFDLIGGLTYEEKSLILLASDEEDAGDAFEFKHINSSLVNLYHDFNIKPSSYKKDNIFELEALGEFQGTPPSPRFMLHWKGRFKIEDLGKARSDSFLNRTLFYQDRINRFIQRHLSYNYTFEVGERNAVSWIYDTKILRENDYRELAEPKHRNLSTLLAEIAEKMNQGFLDEAGVSLTSFSPKKFGPVDPPFLGLWELEKARREKKIVEYEKILVPMFEKIKKAQSEYGDYTPSDEPEKISASETAEEDSEYESLIRINFGKKEAILPEGNEDLREAIKKAKKSQTIPLLKYWLELYCRKKPFHWIYGFIIFETWRNSPPADPLGTLTGYVSTLRKLGDEKGLFKITTSRHVRGKSRRKPGYWSLRDVNFDSNILDAYKLLEKASESPGTNKNTLLEVQRIYPEQLSALISLVEFWEQDTELKSTDLDLIPKVKNRLMEKSNCYRNALGTIYSQQETLRHPYWHDYETNTIVDELYEEWKRIDSKVRILEKFTASYEILSADEAQCKKIIALFERVRAEKDKGQTYLLLLKDDLIKKVIRDIISASSEDWAEKLSSVKQIDLLDALVKMYNDPTTESVNTAIFSEIFSTFREVIISNKIDITPLEAGNLEGSRKELTELLSEEVRNKAIDRSDAKEVHLKESHPSLSKHDEYSEEDEKEQ